MRKNRKLSPRDEFKGVFKEPSPPLTELELLALSIIGSLKEIDMAHRYKRFPRWEPLWCMFVSALWWPFCSRRGWVKFMVRRLEKSSWAHFEPLPSLPLVELWQQSHHAEDFAPPLVDGENLWFRDFVVARRDGGFRTPGAFRALYWVVAPAGSASFRPIAYDASNRSFFARTRQPDGGVPSNDDFGTIRIDSITFDDELRRKPCVLQTHLPQIYAPWELLHPKNTWEPDEKILDDEGDAPLTATG